MPIVLPPSSYTPPTQEVTSDVDLSGYMDGPAGRFYWGAGTYWRVTAHTGLFTMALRTGDQAISGFNGSAFGRDFLDEKTVQMTLTGTVVDSGLSIMTMVNQARQAFYRSDGDTARDVYWSGLGYMQIARVRAADFQFQPGQQHIVIPVQFTSADGYLYGINPQNIYLSTPMNFSGGGAIPAGIPYKIVEGGDASNGAATNNGTEYAYPTIVITGKAVNPYIQNLSTGGVIKFDGTLGITDYITIDTYSETITLNGISSRVEDPATQWWNLPPLSTSTLRFGADSFDVNATCSVQWRDTYG